MLKYHDFKRTHLKDITGFSDDPKGYDVLVAFYAKYIVNEAQGRTIRINACGGVAENIAVELIELDIGKFSALHCCNLLSAENIFVVENEDLGYSMIGANGKENEPYNKVATYIWCGLYKQKEMLYGDILMIKSGEFCG